LHQPSAKIHRDDVEEKVQRAPMDKGDSHEAPRLQGEHVCTRCIDLDQGEGLSDSRECKCGC
jgi:hypothetical protein